MKSNTIMPTPKSGERSQPTNFRPDFYLFYVSNFFEKNINTKIICFLTKHTVSSTSHFVSNSKNFHWVLSLKVIEIIYDAVKPKQCQL